MHPKNTMPQRACDGAHSWSCSRGPWFIIPVAKSPSFLFAFALSLSLSLSHHHQYGTHHYSWIIANIHCCRWAVARSGAQHCTATSTTNEDGQPRAAPEWNGAHKKEEGKSLQRKMSTEIYTAQECMAASRVHLSQLELIGG